MDLFVTTRQMAAYRSPGRPYAVISITTPGDGQAELATSDLCRGALRYYLSAAQEPPEDEIEMLRINRNMIFITDSDKEDEAAALDKTKQRIMEEIDTNKGMGWVTSGRDIENYISRETLLRIYPDIEPDLASQFRRFEEVLEEIEPGSGKRFNKTKVKFARSVLPHITLDDVRSNTHLSEYVDRSCKLIEKWNKMAEGSTW